MDSITQAVLGAAIGEAVLGKKLGKKAAILGAIMGTIPDLDVLISPFVSELQKISIHRGYSHSILFCLVVPFIFVYLSRRFKWFKNASDWELGLFSFLALFTHVLLDAFTSYGTQLFLPFNDWRVSLDSINIVDPVYTLPLIIGLAISLFMYLPTHTKRSIPNSLGLILSSLYLIFTLANKQHIEGVFSEQLKKKGIAYYDLLTVPVKIANYTWYGVVIDADNLYLGKYSTIEKNKIEFDRFPINDQLLDDIDPELADRMKWFSQGFYTAAEHEGKIRIYNMQCDMQGVRTFGGYKAPTAFFFEIKPQSDGSYKLSSGMHNKE